MFACSPVETENIFYNPNKSFNNKGESSTSKMNRSSSPCNNFYYNALIEDNDQQRRRFQQFHETNLKRNQLKQEIQRRHQLCADNERQCRAKTEKQSALKKVEECNALRKFYEIKSAQLKNTRNCNDIFRPALSTTTNSSSSIISSSSTTSTKNSSKELPSKSSVCASIKKFQAAYKIHSFIKYYIEKKKMKKIISLLIKLRSIQNRLKVLKSINLKVRTLTFDSTHKNEVLPISVNNKGFLLYKDSILKVLNQLDADFTDEFYLVRERKQFIKNIANNILKELDNEKNSQYNQFIKKKNVVA